MKKVFVNLGKFLACFSIVVEKIVNVNKQIYNGYLCKKFYLIGEGCNINWGMDLHNPHCIKIGRRCNFGKNAVLSTWGENYGSPKLIIKDNCSFGDYIHLTAYNKIVIGNNVLTGRWVTISDNSHGMSNMDDMKIPPMKRQIISKGAVYIEDNVWIGDKVTILAGVTIGESAIIGANSVVTKNVPSYSIVVGAPAKIVKILK